MINVYPSSQETIDIVHKRVHEGRFFSGTYYNAAVANGSSIEILFQSTTESTHAKFYGASSGDATIYLYEGTTFSAAGTAVTVSNHNRQSAKVFSGTVTHTPTVTTAGTQVNGTGFIPGGTKSSGGGGETGFANEFVLSASTNYLIRLTNNSGGTAKMSVSFETYQPNL